MQLRLMFAIHAIAWRERGSPAVRPIICENTPTGRRDSVTDTALARRPLRFSKVCVSGFQKPRLTLSAVVESVLLSARLV